MKKSISKISKKVSSLPITIQSAGYDRTVNIGIFGLGAVGAGVVRLLHENRQVIWKRCGKVFRITRAVVKNASKARKLPGPKFPITTNPKDILNDPNVDVILELVGGQKLPEEIFRHSIINKKPVVTANKAFLAEQSALLGKLFKQERTCIGMEASVAAAVPILQSLRYGLSANTVSKVYGIVNGTANYILTAMQQKGWTFKEALKEAQQLGFAEADPTFDIKGQDSAHKLAILMGIAFHYRFDYQKITKEGIDRIDPIDFVYAKEFGYVLKLLAIAKDSPDGFEARVHPTLIPSDSILASVSDEKNAVQAFGNFSGPVIAYGNGAGSHPTASAVVADLIGMYEYEELHSPLDGPEEKYFFENPVAPILPPDKIESKFYLRFQVKDQVGVMSTISRHLSDSNISINQMIQKRIPGVKDRVNLNLITDICKEQQIVEALIKIKRESLVLSRLHKYRIEEFS